MMVTPGDQPAPPVPKVSPWPGVGLTLALHGAVALLLLAVQTFRTSDFLLGGWFVSIGVSQLPYMIPAMIIARRTNRPAVLKGLIIGASLTFLLNALCFGVVFAMFATGGVSMR